MVIRFLNKLLKSILRANKLNKLFQGKLMLIIYIQFMDIYNFVFDTKLIARF